jgi:activating signal cointegrator complex subunit 3
VLGDTTTTELIALRRIRFQQQKTTTTLSFDAPDLPGDYCYTLYLMSDSYLGLDQQYDLKFTVTPATEHEQPEEEQEDIEDDQ